MKYKKTLVIMAGGLGSRFGGLKQIEPVDEHNNFIIDYSVFDAVKAGFDKVVFVIKEENYKVFNETIGKRVSNYVNVSYAFQGMDDYVSSDVDYHSRKKPWGTGHAVLCAKDEIDGDFAVINADDFYGADGFKVASNFFDNNHDEKNYAIVSYKAGNTITENGAVKRGVCHVEDGYLVDVVESSIETKDGKIFATPLNSNDKKEIPFDCLVNMNLICFRKNYLEVLESCFKNFLHDKNTDLEKDEFLLLGQLSSAVKQLGVKTKVLSTTAVWHGFTYKEDKEKVVLAIKKLKDDGVYPSSLWG